MRKNKRVGRKNQESHLWFEFGRIRGILGDIAALHVDNLCATDWEIVE
jgi:hypothetical protein